MYFGIPLFTYIRVYVFMHAYFYMHLYVFTCSLFIHMYFNIRRYFMYVIGSLNVRLIADLHRGCDLFHTSGRKWDSTWKWLATWKTIYYKAWPPGEPSGNGKYLYVWNRRTPKWGTWDDDEDKDNCFVCERHIKLPSYC